MSKLYIVGIGPGSLEYLTFKARKIVESSDILIGSKRALELFDDLNNEKIQLSAGNMEEIFKLAVYKAAKGSLVTLLSTGDPGFSGVLKPVLKLADNIDIEVVPGISSIQLCAAKLLIPWDNANIITMHGKGISDEIISMLSNGKPTIILPNSTVAELASFLLENDIDPDRNIAVCEKLSYSDEKIYKNTLKQISNMKFNYMSVLVIF
jgi:cobalt-precorrin-7 (C5)-methyltransferase